MFYKEDGSYDVKAFYEHRLIDEYQEGYGVGEDVGEARGRKLGRNEGQMLERENNIRMLSNAGISNETISSSLQIPIEKIEEILNSKRLKNTLNQVKIVMLMFYKEDGSYDVKAFYEHRLIDEYQEGIWCW